MRKTWNGGWPGCGWQRGSGPDNAVAKPTATAFGNAHSREAKAPTSFVSCTDMHAREYPLCSCMLINCSSAANDWQQRRAAQSRDAHQFDSRVYTSAARTGRWSRSRAGQKLMRANLGTRSAEMSFAMAMYMTYQATIHGVLS
jgi:hypothetical protein